MEFSASGSRRRQPNLRNILLLAWSAIMLPAVVAADPGPSAAAEVRPRYVIEANVDMDAHRISGLSTITVPASNADPLMDVKFLLYANAIRGIERDGRPPITIQEVRLDGRAAPYRIEATELSVSLPERKSRPFDLTIKFSADPPQIPEQAATIDPDAAAEPTEKDVLDDARSENFGIFGYCGNVMSLGSFWYPQLEVRMNGEWVGFRSPGPGDLLHAQWSDFTVTFGDLPKNTTVVASGTGDGRKFIAPGARDFFVLIGRDFAFRSMDVKVGQRTVRVAAYVKPANKARIPMLLEAASSALRTYDRRFGTYTFADLKIVEAPLCGHSGGMEYSGVASLRSGYFKFLDQADLMATQDNESRKIRKWTRCFFEVALVHEIAHQWWSIGVGNDSLRHPFVDEALATWSSLLYFEDRYGADQAREVSDMVLKKPLLHEMEEGVKDVPANLPSSDYRGMYQYGMVIYQKGGLFYAELRGLMGDKAFLGGLRDYYARFRYRLAGPEDLRRILLARAPDLRSKIDALYRKWIEEAHGIGETAAASDDGDGAPSGR